MAFIPLKEFKSVLDTMQEYLSRLTFLSSLRGPANNLRVTITDAAVPVSGTIATVGTVTTMANQTAIGGYNAAMQVMATTNINANISNISNFTIS